MPTCTRHKKSYEWDTFLLSLSLWGPWRILCSEHASIRTVNFHQKYLIVFTVTLEKAELRSRAVPSRLKGFPTTSSFNHFHADRTNPSVLEVLEAKACQLKKKTKNAPVHVLTVHRPPSPLGVMNTEWKRVLDKSKSNSEFISSNKTAFRFFLRPSQVICTTLALQ